MLPHDFVLLAFSVARASPLLHLCAVTKCVFLICFAAHDKTNKDVDDVDYDDDYYDDDD